MADERKALEPGAVAVHAGGNRSGEVQNYERGNVERDLPRRMWFWRRATGPSASSTRPWSFTAVRGQVGWRSPHPLGVHPGRLCGSGKGRRGPWPSAGQCTGHRPLHGGGFGSKLQAGKYTIIAALLAKKAGRPVKLFLTREETYLCVGNRPPAT